MIKNFIYLDVDKVTSLSSQLFVGVTEYVIRETAKSHEDSEQQKGPVGTGKILADILIQQSRTTEKIYLHDHSYSILESQIESLGKIADTANWSSISSIESDLSEGKSFVKIKGRITFNDIRLIRNTMNNFNKIGLALTHLSNFQEISDLREQVAAAKTSTKDRNERDRLDRELKRITDIKTLAKQSNLLQDEEMLKDLAFMLDYGYQNQLEVTMPLNNNLFSASLKRESLRENEELIIQKYSRTTNVEFTMFGIVTQYKDGLLTEDEHDVEAPSLRVAIKQLVNRISDIEKNFMGRATNEIVFDPIAIYTQI